MIQLLPNMIIRGPHFPEPVRVLVVTPMGITIKLIGTGIRSNQTYQRLLTQAQLKQIEIVAEAPTFDGNARYFRLGVEALRLGIAYEYDPHFALSIARVDPLPHQLEAVYDYFLKLPRIRFLLADDPGAGKTIMAGLLIKELKIRGLVRRILIICPANLTFQWQRELRDKFREEFTVLRGETLRASYGKNPWVDHQQAISSISWVSRVEDARDSLLASQWDLIIVDEAHKMSAASRDKKTLAYQLGEALSERTDHYLLMTATPHKGDPQHFALFLELLDPDVYGDTTSLEEALRRREAPFYLRRVKEALVTFPDPATGTMKLLFTKRDVRTSEFQIDAEEWEFYHALTKYVESQSVKAAQEESARGRAVGFTMALLQRRFASSLYAVRRSLERMKLRREQMLAHPDQFRQTQITRRLPEDFDDLMEEEQAEILEAIEALVPSVDPYELQLEITMLHRLIEQALQLETREIETKLRHLRNVLQTQGIFQDEKMKLLIFTEHKDTLDYLVGKLMGWGLKVVQIHGGMAIGDRDRPGTRLHAERAFRDEAQVLVATEAAGEGINLQFCWLMINYDIPWNPVRLEQRMGRIHRYGQEKDCLVFNFVATNTAEGRVLQKLFERVRRIEDDIDPARTGKVFNVLGDIFPANELERLVREMYVRNQTVESITDRIITEVDTERFQRLTQGALEGLAKRSLNLTAIVGRVAEAKEKRLIPEVIGDFFVQAAPVAGLLLKEVRGRSHIYRVGRIPNLLRMVATPIEERFGRLAHDYHQITFDKNHLNEDPTLEWVTPGHPLFETVRSGVLERVEADLQHGAVFYDLHRTHPARLDLYQANIKEGRGIVLEERLFIMERTIAGDCILRQPTLFLDIGEAPIGTEVPDTDWIVNDEQMEICLYQQGLEPLLQEVMARQQKEVETIRRHVEISLNELIHRQNSRLAILMAEPDAALQAANVAQVTERIDLLNHRLEQRRLELAQAEACTISDVRRIGQAWVLPHPDRADPTIAPLIEDSQIEQIAVATVRAYEASRGWDVESVESENRGFDLVSRPRSPAEGVPDARVRFIEVKGRATSGDVVLTENEYKTALRLKEDYWLYVVYDCATTPTLRRIQNPAIHQWDPIRRVAHYQLKRATVLREGQADYDV